MKLKLPKMPKYAQILARPVPQTQRLNDRQIPNHAGGFGYAVSDLAMLDRFVILGTVGGTFYVGERELTAESVEAVSRAITAHGVQAVARIVELDVAGRAAKKSPALFALALAAKEGDEATRAAAYAAIPKVCRTGSHLFEFLANLDAAGKGWGRGLKRAVGRWYTDRTEDEIVFGAVKYAQRSGYTHRDALRLAHPKSDSAALRWIARGGEAPTEFAAAAERIKTLVSSPSEAAGLIASARLPREAVPTELLGSAEVWRALLPAMPLTALVRNLGKMTSIGVFADAPSLALAVGGLTDEAALKRGRVHPLSLLVAMKVYGSGKGFRGSLAWEAEPQIMAALDRAYLASFGALPRLEVPTLVGVDVSGSMGQRLPEHGGLALHEAAACVSIALGAMNPGTAVRAFDHRDRIFPVDVLGRRTDDVYRELAAVGGGGTDLSIPVRHALGLAVRPRLLVILTDNETWAGHTHCDQAWIAYRREVPDARLVVASMVANRIAAFDDAGGSVLQIAGFDAGLPNVVASFAGFGEVRSEEE